MYREQVDHHLQLDNTWPTIGPNGLQVYVNGPDNTQGNLVPLCGNETTGANEFQIWGRSPMPTTRDSVCRSPTRTGCQLRPAQVVGSERRHRHPAHQEHQLDGYHPDLRQPVHLRNINLATALGVSFVHCCYDLNLTVWDASIVHGFNTLCYSLRAVPPYRLQLITFAAGP